MHAKSLAAIFGCCLCCAGWAQTTQPVAPTTAPATAAPANAPTTAAPANAPATAAAVNAPSAPVAASGPATGSAAAEPSADAQAAAPAQPAVQLPDSWLTRLGNASWRQRKAAQDELIAMGQRVRPMISDWLRRPNLDVEARVRLEAVAAQIDQDRVLGPSYITMHVKNASVKSVFADLSRQCFSELHPFPENLLDQPDLPKVTLDIEHQPFWQAMQVISAKTGVDLQQYNEGVKLMRGSFHVTSNYAVIQGPFWVVPNAISRTQTEMLANGGGSSSDFSLQLMAYSEPKLHVLSSSAMLKIAEAVDSAGNSLVPTGMENRGYYGGSGGTWNLFAQLKYPEKNAGDHIAHLKGSASFVVQTRSQHLQIPNIRSIHDQAQMVGETAVLFRELKKVNDLWELRLQTDMPNFGSPRWMQFNQSVQNDLQLVDDNNQPLDHRGMRSQGNGNHMEFTILFARSQRALDGRGSNEPAAVLWDVPTASKEMVVTFDLKDLPMPH